jgi:membrane protein YqaA with SNARE-associated domain
MDGFIKQLFATMLHLGSFGLLIVGVLDSSFLFMPLGNDLLVIAMTATAGSHWKVLFYAGMAAAGSVLGCALTDVIARTGGEESLEKYVPHKRLEYVRRKIKNEAAWTLALAAVMPPPFPFTPFVAGAAALDYSRKKLLTIIGVTRFFRFSAEGVLAVFFGENIIRLAKTPVVRWSIVALMVIAVVGSIASVSHWIKRSRSATSAKAA